VITEVVFHVLEETIIATVGERLPGDERIVSSIFSGDPVVIGFTDDTVMTVPAGSVARVVHGEQDGLEAAS
jgi:hypothetical protein